VTVRTVNPAIGHDESIERWRRSVHDEEVNALREASRKRREARLAAIYGSEQDRDIYRDFRDYGGEA
jgi:hypothetical protein